MFKFLKGCIVKCIATYVEMKNEENGTVNKVDLFSRQILQESIALRKIHLNFGEPFNYSISL